MGNTNKTIIGLTAAGRIVQPSDFSKVEEVIFGKSMGFDQETITILAQYACNEHLDDVTHGVVAQILAIQLLKISLHESLEDAEQFFRTTKDGTEYDFGNYLARSLKDKVRKMKIAADTFSGYSDTGRRKMIKSLAKELCSLFAENFEFYSTKYDFIIKDGI